MRTSVLIVLLMTAACAAQQVRPIETCNVCDFGAIPNDAIEDTEAVQRAIAEAARTRGEVFFPAGTYLLNAVRINESDKVSLRGVQSILRATRDAKTIIDADADFNKDQLLSISGLVFTGRDDPESIGLKIRHAATNVHISDCSFLHLGIGFDGLAQYNLSLDNCVFALNRIGLQLRGAEDGVLGVSNANSFENCEIYANTVGVSIYNGGVNNLFSGCTIQNNPLCGVAAFNQDNTIFDVCHFEANGIAAANVEINGVTVQRSQVHAVDSVLTFRDTLIGNGAAAVVAEHASDIIVAGRAIYSGNPFVDDRDGDSRLITDTATLLNIGATNRSLQRGPLPINFRAESFSAFATLAEPVTIDRPDILNQIPKTSQRAPRFYNKTGIEDSGFIQDDLFGKTAYVDFADHPGTTGDNRVMLDLGFGTVDIGDRLALTMLVKSDRTAEVNFRIGGGIGQNYVGSLCLPKNKWIKLIVACRATVSSTSPLWIYPKDDSGPVVQFCRPMAGRVAQGGDYYPLEQMLIEYAYSGSGED